MTTTLLLTEDDTDTLRYVLADAYRQFMAIKAVLDRYLADADEIERRMSHLAEVLAKATTLAK